MLGAAFIFLEVPMKVFRVLLATKDDVTVYKYIRKASDFSSRVTLVTGRD